MEKIPVLKSIEDKPKIQDSFFIKAAHKIKTTIGLGATVATIGLSEGSFNKSHAQDRIKPTASEVEKSTETRASFLNINEINTAFDKVTSKEDAEILCEKYLDAFVDKTTKSGKEIHKLGPDEFVVLQGVLERIQFMYDTLNDKYAIDTTAGKEKLKQVMEFVNFTREFTKMTKDGEEVMADAGGLKNLASSLTDTKEEVIDTRDFPPFLKTIGAEFHDLQKVFEKNKDEFGNIKSEEESKKFCEEFLDPFTEKLPVLMARNSKEIKKFTLEKEGRFMSDMCFDLKLMYDKVHQSALLEVDTPTRKLKIEQVRKFVFDALAVMSVEKINDDVDNQLNKLEELRRKTEEFDKLIDRK